jgi:competence protein ComEA
MKPWMQNLTSFFIGITAAAVMYLIAAQPQGTPIELLPTLTPAPVIIHVDGAVSTPGLYTLPYQSRIADAIATAGGLLPNADTSSINLAAKLVDGQKIYIPIQGTPAPQVSTTTNDQPIDINTADQAQLETLPGIGPTRAMAIIEYRSSHGPFQTIEDIQNVPGIGHATFENLKDHIFVSKP